MSTTLGEAEIYHLFGSPVTEVLETESGEPTGPEELWQQRLPAKFHLTNDEMLSLVERE